ncbi:hypothetical protein EON65_08575 [archaeon]|nr:MAG: hypothetical protein EON65_08575 [archaeon]
MSKKSDDITFPRLTGVNYEQVLDRQVGDKRFEREKTVRESSGAAAVKPVMSSTFDAFQRMAAGLEGRTISDKINDPTRPTWEQYKKENEDKLDIVGSEVRKMVEYRAQLDKERDDRLKSRKRELFVEDSDEKSDSSGSRKKSKKSKKSKKKHKKHKKHKSEKKSKKHSKGNSGSDSDNSSDSNSSKSTHS